MGKESRLNLLSKDGPLLPPRVKDKLGRTLQVGDVIFLLTGTMQPYFVESIAPVIDPNAPANLMDIRLVSHVRFHAVRDQAQAEFVRIVERTERGLPEGQTEEDEKESEKES